MATTNGSPYTYNGITGKWELDAAHAQPTVAPAQAPQNTLINQGSSGIVGSGGSLGGITAATKPSGQVYVAPGSKTALLTQGAYEQERQLGLQQTGDAAQQQANREAEMKMQQAAEAAKRGQMELSQRLHAQDEQRRLGLISSVGGSGAPTVQHSAGPAFDENAARQAAFSRAKEQAGQTAMSSLQSLKGIMEGSGRMGSSMEASGIADVLGGARGDINDFTSDQLMSDLDRAGEISDMEYQGNIQQRGQDLSRMQSLLGLLSASGGVY